MRLLVLAAAAALVPALSLPAQRPSSSRSFEIEVEHARLPALSQDNTGTCWSFATTSFLESELQRIHGAPTDLSELHTVYYGYLEKARRYVRLHGKAQFSQGGLSHDLIDVVARYGIAPQSAYDGLAGDATRHDHGELEAMLKAIVDQVATSERPSPRWEDAVRGVLSAYLGAPPPSFDAGAGSVTPLEYAHRELQIPVDSYREVMSLQGEGFWRRATLLVPDNWSHDDDYWNVPLEQFLENLDHALRTGFTVAVDIDVSERGTRGPNRWVWELPKKLETDGAITDDLRQRMFDSRETTDDHLMHVVAIAHDDDGKQFYLTKNSWGADGPYDGHVMISRNYMAAKLLAFMVHEDGLMRDTVERFR